MPITWRISFCQGKHFVGIFMHRNIDVLLLNTFGTIPEQIIGINQLGIIVNLVKINWELNN